VHDLPDFKLEVHFSRWEFAARYHLTASDAETITLAELLALGSEEDRSRFASQPLGYTPTWGSPQLLEAVADIYTQLGPEHVLGFTGAEEAMFWALQELVGPGDHAIVTVPNYQSMETLVLSTDASVDALPLRAEKDWALELDVLEGLLRPNTKLVAVNFPNNPTGAVPDQASFRRLVEICEENSIRLFSDEVFRGLELDSSTTLPQAADISATAISLNVMSKSYGLPGLRIGWLASRDRALLERLERRKHYTSICSSGPSEQLAVIALHASETLLSRNREIIARNIPSFNEFFARWPEHFDWRPPTGGCIAFPRLTTGESTDTFCERLVETSGVLLLPAGVYQSQLAPVPTDRFRIGVGRRDPEPALQAFDSFLAAETNNRGVRQIEPCA
jgi:aspartate/methionine/tyrosine aminotransferase